VHNRPILYLTFLIGNRRGKPLLVLHLHMREKRLQRNNNEKQQLRNTTGNNGTKYIC